jgi:hypothetical protein
MLSRRPRNNYNSSRYHDGYNSSYTNRRAPAHRRNTAPRYSEHKTEFHEIPGAAFFIGKLNKNLCRDTVYSALRKAANAHDFYIKKLDMPYGMNREGNKGFAFVHTETVEQADKIIRMGKMTLNGQQCEIRPYGGRKSNDANARSGFDSGCTTGVTTPVNEYDSPQEEHHPAMIIKQVSKELNQRVRTNTVSSSDADSVLHPADESFTDSQVKVEIIEESFEQPAFEFTYENVEPIVLEEQSKALAAGMSEMTFAMNYNAWYVHYLDELERGIQENAQEVEETRYGLEKYLARRDKINNNQIQAF